MRTYQSSMNENPDKKYFAGKILIAMPDMTDPRFSKCIILMIFHSDAGAMGIVVNKPAGHIEISEFVNEGERKETQLETIPIHFGGPMDHSRAFIIHSVDCRQYSSTRQVSDHFGITMTPDILEELSNGEGPASSLFAFGYAGWAPGQLESELQHNVWLICDGDPDLVFNVEPNERWDAAIKSLGFSPAHLSAGGGSA